jgi:hypothetical protein
MFLGIEVEGSVQGYFANASIFLVLANSVDERLCWNACTECFMRCLYCFWLHVSSTILGILKKLVSHMSSQEFYIVSDTSSDATLGA